MGTFNKEMESYKIGGWCSKHTRSAKTVDGPHITNKGFYVIYDCCISKGPLHRLRTEYVRREEIRPLEEQLVLWSNL